MILNVLLAYLVLITMALMFIVKHLDTILYKFLARTMEFVRGQDDWNHHQVAWNDTQRELLTIFEQRITKLEKESKS